MDMRSSAGPGRTTPAMVRHRGGSAIRAETAEAVEGNRHRGRGHVTADLVEENYTLVVAQPNPHSPWEWEVYRNGAPLPARLHKGGFRSEGNARAAGKMALLEFLVALAREMSRDLP
jgi:hypothetical protein